MKTTHALATAAALLALAGCDAKDSSRERPRSRIDVAPGPPAGAEKKVVPPRSEVEGKVPLGESPKEQDDAKKAAETGNDAQYRPELEAPKP